MKYSELWKQERPCPFDGEQKDRIILENKSAYLTYALAPYHPDHLLVIPKRHVEHILDVTTEEMADIDVLQRKAWDILRKLGYTSVSFIVREGVGSGRTINHLHYHVIPEVRLGDVDHNGDEREIMTQKQIDATLARVRATL
jgi:diadenosine tetraphosphate (Ap4A) HIT family hydrolase